MSLRSLEGRASTWEDLGGGGSREWDPPCAALQFFSLLLLPLPPISLFLFSFQLLSLTLINSTADSWLLLFQVFSLAFDFFFSSFLLIFTRAGAPNSVSSKQYCVAINFQFLWDPFYYHNYLSQMLKLTRVNLVQVCDYGLIRLIQINLYFYFIKTIKIEIKIFTN